MLIVSWNVAGLKPALQKIHSDYGSSSSSVAAAASSSSSIKSKSEIGASAKKKDSIDPFANYIRLHGDVDILCLQEHKIPLTQLSSRSEPHRCSSIEGYESFWSCATDKAVKGFNGVCTYAKVGLVQSANSTPFNNPELDSQGRCIMTNHGNYVVFNVYVPCGGVKTPMPEKMKFLKALSDAMQRQRDEGKHVVLVGDMNLKSDKRDVQWGHRSLNVDEILEEMKQQNDNGKDNESVPKWKIDLANNWNKIELVLETKEAVPRQTTNPSTKEKFNRFKVRVKVGDNHYEELGSNEDSAEEALCYYTFDEGSYVDPDTDETIVCRKKNRLCIVTLVELMHKIANVKWNVDTQRQVAEEAGLNPDHPPTQWVRGLMEGNNGMVDVFRHFYPTAEARFTVWHQFQQKRYTNEGTRIDFTLVDQPLMEYVHPNDGKTLRCGKEPHTDPLGEEAAFNAATAGGLFEGGSYGGGISTATQRALDTQFGEYSHTGMIYTPPSYSDHIAVSLLMKSTFREYTGQLTLSNDSNTKKAQPHKKQRSISSFFSASSKSSSSISSKSTTSKSTGMKRSASTQAEKEKEKKKSMYSFFGNNTNKTKENDGNKDTTAKAASSKDLSNKEEDEKKKKSMYSFFGNNKTKENDGNKDTSAKAASAKAASTKDVSNKKGASSKEEDEEKKKSMYSFFGNSNKDTSSSSAKAASDKDMSNKKEASSKKESSSFDC